jgi:riboflavin kinase/FMN adenylyltransferase
LELFRRSGIEHTLVLSFDDDLRNTSATDFAKDLLMDQLGGRALVLGFDSKFGRNQEGTPELLRQIGFPVEVVDKVVVDQRAVSSTAIREAVGLGDLDGAGAMLGRPVSVLGTVIHGSALGRTLGFPTANLDLHHELHPPAGVYAGRAHLLSSDSAHDVEETHLAVCNVGLRPTIQDQEPRALGELLVEVHLLDYEGDVYGRRLELEFTQHLRNERRFEGLDALKAQIRLDVDAARTVLA